MPENLVKVGVLVLFLAGLLRDLEYVTVVGQALSTLMLLLGGCMIGVSVAIVATGFEVKSTIP